MEAARAIADPVRRRILVMLAGEPMTAGAIADAFDVSRPAISRHLRVLREHGLVHDEAVGRERVYRLDVAPLAPVEAWIARLRASVALPGALDALATEVHRARRDHARGRDATEADATRTSAKEQSA
jgi:DNA-binding transcriptional ArsR family regulator